MDELKFWSLIERIDRTKLTDDDGDEAVAPLLTALIKEPVEALYAFDKLLQEKVDALRTPAHLHAAVAKTADSFLYLALFIIAKGSAYYQEVLQNPSAMPDTHEDCEALLYVAEQAYSEKTGEDDYYDRINHLSQLQCD